MLTSFRRNFRCGLTGLHKVRTDLEFPFQFESKGEYIRMTNGLYSYRRQKALLNPVSPSDEPESSPHIPAGPKKDYSLKEGQTFSISIPGGGKTPNRSSLLGAGSGGGASNLLGGLGGNSGGGGVPLLPPPPSVKRK